jgi:cholesterol oxidase
MAGLTLRERLVGWWSPDAAPDVDNLAQYLDSAAAGEEAGRALDLRLSLRAPNVEALIDDLGTPIEAVGTAAAGGLLDAPAAVADGVLQLKVPEADDPDVSHMRYALPIPEAGLHVEGFKVLTDGDLGQLWGASTTLFVTLRSDGPAGPVVGRGVAQLSPAELARQLTTLDITDEDDEVRQLVLLARFGRAFLGALWDDYGTVIQRPSRLRRHAPPRVHRPLDVPPRTTLGYRTDDGVDLRLTRYRGGDRGPVVLVHGMGANPLTYTLDTIRPNLVEVLVAERFDVWLQEWRGSTLLPTSATLFDADQVARFDHPAAERAVRQATGRSEVHWVTHCVGSMTWMMATLAGRVDPASLVLSQVGAHPVAPTLSRLKAEIRAPGLLRALGVRHLTTDSYDDQSLAARAVDQLLRLHPVPRDERCDSAVCRRLAFIYGLAIRHAAVDDTTHRHLHELFGITNLQMMAHLARCALDERLVDATGADVYLPNVERARRPMTFLSGSHNGVWRPASTERDMAWLTRELGEDGFTRELLHNHGHQDSLMGAEAHERAFPAVLDHLRRAGC